MKLKPFLTVHAKGGARMEVGKGPYGTRLIFNTIGGTFEGKQLKGKILANGGDWMLIDGEGFGHIDARIVLETSDKALIYVQYYGVVKIDEKIKAALNGGTTEYEDTFFIIQPRFETGDERYKWLNNMITVGEGRLIPHAVEYRIYKIDSDPLTD